MSFIKIKDTSGNVHIINTRMIVEIQEYFFFSKKKPKNYMIKTTTDNFFIQIDDKTYLKIIDSLDIEDLSI